MTETSLERLPQNGDSAAYALTREEAAVLERVMLDGDLSQLTGPDRIHYYLGLCKSLRLNPMTRPFEYVTFDRKLVLYARKDCAEQLRRIHNVSIIDLRMEQAADLCIVTATARMPNGRTDIDQGIVDTAGLRGQVFANARLKCTTKAKRRVTLSICGLGIMDETEVETIPGARRVRVNEETGEILEEAPPAALPARTHRATATVAQPKPAPSARVAEQKERGRRLKAEADALGVDVTPFRPDPDTATPDDVDAMLTALERLLAEVRAQRETQEEVAA